MIYCGAWTPLSRVKNVSPAMPPTKSSTCGPVFASARECMIRFGAFDCAMPWAFGLLLPLLGWLLWRRSPRPVPVRLAELDDLGVNVSVDANGYENLLNNLAGEFAGCLEKL